MNCYIAAWRAYSSGEAVWMSCRKTYRARFGIPPRIVRAVGTLIIWPATALWLLGHMLKFGNWPHWVYCQTLSDDCKEYTPENDDKAFSLPPILFAGKTRKVERIDTITLREWRE